MRDFWDPSIGWDVPGLPQQGVAGKVFVICLENEDGDGGASVFQVSI